MSEPTKKAKGSTTSTAKKATRANSASNGRSRANGSSSAAKASSKSAQPATNARLFQPVPAPTRVDYPLLERDVQQWWDDHDIVNKYLTRNEHAKERWSFVDGPITANNPMGVHHAWGRTYKDLWQRFNTMRGYRQRYQNGFDCQGLWVEVEVEKELEMTNKRQIEEYGIGRFVEKCKARVLKFSDVQTQQSIRLGEWMRWDDSY